MSRRSANWNSFGSSQWLAGEMPELDLQLVTAPTTLTSQAAADSFFATDTSYQAIMDAAGLGQVRLTGICKTASTSVNSPKLQLRYSIGYTTTVANKLILGKTSVEISMFTGATLMDSGWIDLVPAARVNNLVLGLMMIGGDATNSPVVNQVMASFR